MMESTFKTWEDILEDGKVLAKRDALKRIVRKSFTDAPQSVLERIDAIDDIARLDELFDRALDAKSLDDIPL